jgi:hypothetical protein
LNAVDLERMTQISASDLPSLRATTASVSALSCGSVVGEGNFSRCYRDYKQSAGYSWSNCSEKESPSSNSSNVA